MVTRATGRSASGEIIGKEGGIKAPFRVNLGPDQLKVLQDSGMSPQEFISQSILEKAGKDETTSTLLSALKTNNKMALGGQEISQNSPNPENRMSNIKNMMAEAMEMTMMERMMDKLFNEKKSGEDIFEKIFKINQIQKMMNDSNTDDNSKDKLAEMFKSEVGMIRNDIDDKKKWEQIIGALKTKNDANQIGMPEMLQIYGNRDDKLEKYRIDAENARSQNLQINLQNQIDRLTDVVASSSNNNGNTLKIQELSDTLKAVKELSSEITGTGEKSKSMNVNDIIKSTLPVLKPLAEAASQSMVNNQYAQEQVPVNQPEMNIPTENVDIPQDVNPESAQSIVDNIIDKPVKDNSNYININ